MSSFPSHPELARRTSIPNRSPVRHASPPHAAPLAIPGRRGSTSMPRRESSLSLSHSASFENKGAQWASPGSPGVPGKDGGIGNWTEWAGGVTAKDLLSTSASPHITLPPDTPVERACELMASNDVSCIAVAAPAASGNFPPDPWRTAAPSTTYYGLFDYADMNALLLIILDAHNSALANDNPRVAQIVSIVRKGGSVPVRMACDISGKNPLVTLHHSTPVLQILELLASGTHRVLITGEVEGIISDRRMTRWFQENAAHISPLPPLLHSPLYSLLPQPSPLVSLVSTETVLECMRTLSSEGVSSLAVLEPSTFTLIAAVSVIDIGKYVVPSADKNILGWKLHDFVSFMRSEEGLRDGKDRYPIFTVSPRSTLDFTISKLLATNAHRVFLLPPGPTIPHSPSSSLSSSQQGSSALADPSTVQGVVSIADLLSIFARAGGIADIDPGRMRRRRRASSSASSSARSSISGSLGSATQTSSAAPSDAGGLSSSTGKLSRALP